MPSEEASSKVSPDLPVSANGQKSPSKVGGGESDPENPEQFFVTEVGTEDTPRPATVEQQLDEPDTVILDAGGNENGEEDFLSAEEENSDDEGSSGSGDDEGQTADDGDDKEDYDTDLEMEEPERWLHPELFDRDTTGINRYLRMCQRLDIQPITYFLKHMQDSRLIMKYHGIGPLGVKAMSDPLECNTTIEKMDLEGNYILGIGTTYLSRVLKDNVYVTELILSENKMGNEGGRAICDLLIENKTIIYLDLKGNNIEDGVAEDFYDMLSKNTDLKTLILRHNSFEDAGATHLKNALLDNDTLLNLDLSWNHFQWKGCCEIAEGIQDNQGLQRLNLCMNGFGAEGAKALEDALKQNKTLIELDVSFCRIPMEGAPHIAAGVQNNDVLENFNVGYNPIQSEGGLVVLLALDRNEKSALKLLDFGNLTVKKDFDKLANSLIDERKIDIRYGGVLPDVTSFHNPNVDMWKKHVNDPMTKLKQWLDQTGYRLVDLLLTFDRSCTLTIDLDELKLGVKTAGIDMTETEVESLFLTLDDDGSGEIDMKELVAGDELHTLAERQAKLFKEEQEKEDVERRKLMKEGDAKDFHKIIEASDTIKPIAIV